MTTERKQDHVSVKDYLAGEETAPVKHEYVGGTLYAMVGATNRHDRIATNIVISVGSRLRGHRCQVFNSDTKTRLIFPTHVRFYYPDASVICRPNDQSDSFQDAPVIVFEVLSGRTRRTDEGEKKDAYISLPSLAVYVMVEQGSPRLTLFQRQETGFVRETCEGLGATLPLGEIGLALPLAEIYEGVRFEGKASELDIDHEQD